MTGDHDDWLSLRDLERMAMARLDQAAFDYIAGGSGDEITLAANTQAFTRWRLRPRVLVDVSDSHTNTTFLGQAVAVPFGIAPIAFQQFAHADAEPATARAATSAGAVFCLSTMSSRSIEEVAAAAAKTGGGPRWFQLYVHRDRARSAELVHRAQSAGYAAIVVTADFPVAGLRERDRRNGLAYPQTYGNFELRDEAAQPTQAVALTIGALNDSSLTWDDLAWLRDVTSLPIVIKGILTGEDAALAVEHGAAAVVVSNHGGRQLDRTPATIDTLPEIVAAVAGRIEVYMDGGVRRGIDVLTALALGARGVFVGRPMMYALAAGGEKGVSRALGILEYELRTDMALLGVSRVTDISRTHVRQV